jgi:hypothetical protein
MTHVIIQESTTWWTDEELVEIHSKHVTDGTHEIQTSIREVYDKLFPYLSDT